MMTAAVVREVVSTKVVKIRYLPATITISETGEIVHPSPERVTYFSVLTSNR